MAAQVRDALPVLSEGAVAAGDAAAGSPVPAGADYNVTPPSYSTGQRATLQTDSRGSLRVELRSGASSISVLAATTTVAVSASTVCLDTRSFPYKSDGTQWRADSRPATVSRIVSAAGSTNATSAKASAGDLHRIRGYNAAAAVRYLKIYNKASAPTVGTDTPVLTYALAPSSVFDIEVGGFYFSTGIAYAMTTGSADADTGALTAADVVGLNVTYA